MDQLRQLYANLTLKQRLSLLAAVLAVAAGLWGLARWNKERDFKPLYTGLAAEDAGAVMAKLKETGVEYRVGEGGTLLVPSARVAELRLQLASAGLPKTGRIGYELFDKTNFGQTEFAEQVNFKRALEGELERSISGLAEVESARVHLTFPKDSVFLESRQPAKASVLVKLKTGMKLSPANVMAIQHLTASAVEGLLPEAVSVLDMNGTLLSKPKSATPDEAEESEQALEYRRKVERDLLAKVNTTLEPLLGAEKFRAGVNAECDFTSGEQSEEVFDPNRSVMTNSQRTEDTSGIVTASGVPGTASSLPRPTSRPGSGSGGVTRRSETISYQTSRLIKRLKLPQGAIRRLSVSVLVDYRARWEGAGAKARRVVEPLAPEKLKTIRDIVAGITGFSAERGDQLIVETLPFDATQQSEPPVVTAPAAPTSTPSFPAWLPVPFRDKTVLMAVGGLVLLLVLLQAAIVLFWLRARRRRAAAKAAAELAAATAKQAELAAAHAQERKSLEEQIAANAAEKQKQLEEAVQSLKVPVATSKKSEALVKHITEETKKNPEAITQLVRSWLMESQQ